MKWHEAAIVGVLGLLGYGFYKIYKKQDSNLKDTLSFIENAPQEVADEIYAGLGNAWSAITKDGKVYIPNEWGTGVAVMESGQVVLPPISFPESGYVHFNWLALGDFPTGWYATGTSGNFEYYQLYTEGAPYNMWFGSQASPGGQYAIPWIATRNEPFYEPGPALSPTGLGSWQFAW